MSSNYIIDLRSDTVSMPTPKMRKAMFDAVVGDDVYGEDPTVLELERKSAILFEKESALFIPSGTMANLLAIMVHCHRRGTEAIVGDLSHTFLYEQGGASHIAGVQLATIQNRSDGSFCLEELRRKIRSNDCHEPITSLIVVENTHNMCGGKVVPLEWLDKLVALVNEPDVSRSHIALHMDGARIFNAANWLNVSVARITKDFDSICFCLSKGLSAPAGSMLVGSSAFISEARRLRKSLGGGMRQVGILAAAGLVALETIVPRLSDDHRRAKRIAEAIYLMQSPNVTADFNNTQTNIILITILNPKLTADDLAKRLGIVTEKELEDGITTDAPDLRGIVLKISARDWQFARIVLYNQIEDKDVELSIKKIRYVISEIDSILNVSI